MFGGDYIAGMDIMNAKNYVIADNVFVGIGGFTGQARGAIFIWNGSEDCTIERNIIIDSDTGICLGNSHRTPVTKTPIFHPNQACPYLRRPGHHCRCGIGRHCHACLGNQSHPRYIESTDS